MTAVQSRPPENNGKTEEKKSRRVQVVFDDRALEVLEQLQQSTGKSVADVVRDALGFYDWARQQVEEGKSVAIVDHEKNRVREFLLPFAQRKAGR